MKKDDCIFCKLANGEIPTNAIYEDEDFKVILDAAPATKGHALILPKEHFDNLFELEESVASRIMPLAKKVGLHMKEVLGCDGFNVLQNNGETAGQTVFHFHTHLIPRYADKPVILTWGHETFSEDEIKEICRILKAKPDQLLTRLENLVKEEKTAKKELEAYKAKAAAGAVDALCENALDVNGVKIVASNAGDVDGDSLKTMGDKIKDKLGCGVVILASTGNVKVSFVVMATDDAVKKGANSGKIVKVAAECTGGGGGGKPNMARAGGKDASKIDEALNAAQEEAKSQIK